MNENVIDKINYIHSLSKFGKKAGLSNIKEILKRLGNPQNDLKFIHVAGTNAKGSVSNMINNILISHNYKVGYFTSPYIEFFNERISINNINIDDNDLINYVERVKNVIDGINPIEFEFITAMAFLYFKEQKCDIVVLEVGLGGRFDATNVIDTALVNVITPIDIDHTNILGNTIEEIAFEKAGTIKENSKVIISSEMNKKAVEVINKKCIETSSRLFTYDDIVENLSYDKDYTRFKYKGVTYELSLKGTYQVSNALLAINAVKLLGEEFPIDVCDIKRGLKNSRWKCRFEIFDNEVTTILDGAHNPNGVGAFLKSLNVYYPEKNKVFVFSMLDDKDWKKSLDLIIKENPKIIITKVPSFKRQSMEDEIIKYLSENGIKPLYIEDYVSAYQKAVEISDKNTIISVFGSLYLVGALRKYVK